MSKTFTKTIEARTVYQLIREGFIPYPTYKDMTVLQQTFLSFSVGYELIETDNKQIRLQAIAEAMGVKFKEKE